MTIDATQPSDDELPELDARARAAAAGLRAHMAVDLDVETAIGFLPKGHGAGRRRSKVLAIAAALALLAATAGVVGSADDDADVEVEVDGDSEASPVLPTGTLTPLGPRDGKDSIRLPLTAEPNTGLVDGQEVTVSGSGFQPGESVGLVQCAKQAGGDTPETRGGVDGCYIGNYTNITADDGGVATGTYKVHRQLTTPLTGTIDCAAEAERCMVAMGALSDYDRSGVHPISFDPNVEPLVLPTITVTPTDGLSDGAVVHVVAEGLTPGDQLYAEVCSSDPVACTQASVPDDSHDGADDGADDDPDATTAGGDGGGESFDVGMMGLDVDRDGRAEGDLAVWQYLPGEEPGTYVDCAVSRCSLRLSGRTAPPTVPLAFVPGDGPTAPSAVLEPSEALAVGDETVLRGAGFRPGAVLMLRLCAHRGESLDVGYVGCAYTEGPETIVGDDGTVTLDYVIPEILDETQMMECTSEEECREAQPGPPVACGRDGIVCELQVESYTPRGGPSFLPPPIPLTFR